MGRFFFDLGSADGLHQDDYGVEFPSVEEAYLGACAAAIEISAEVQRQRSDPSLWWFEIRDSERRLVMEVPFREALRPAPPASDDANERVRLGLSERQVRARKLLDELREGFDEARRTLDDIRRSLNRPAAEPEG